MIEHSVLLQIETAGIVAVIRADSPAGAAAIADACVKGGVSILEVTFTVPGAPDVIRELVQRFENSGALIGAGTVLTRKDALAAIEAGARFLVSPAFDPDVSALSKNSGVPYIPGCLTITEMIHAQNHGAELIKLFPGSAFGPSYIKAVMGPLPGIRLMPTGGVRLDSVKEWIDAGAVAVGVGSELTHPAKHHDYEGVTKLAKAFVVAVQSARMSR